MSKSCCDCDKKFNHLVQLLTDLVNNTCIIAEAAQAIQCCVCKDDEEECKPEPEPCPTCGHCECE